MQLARQLVPRPTILDTRSSLTQVILDFAAMVGGIGSRDEEDEDLHAMESLLRALSRQSIAAIMLNFGVYCQQAFLGHLTLTKVEHDVVGG